MERFMLWTLDIYTCIFMYVCICEYIYSIFFNIYLISAYLCVTHSSMNYSIAVSKTDLVSIPMETGTYLGK